MVTIEELVQQLVERGGSDLHISAGAPPMIRINGKLVSTEQEVLDSETTKKLIYSILDNDQILRFEKELELDMSFGISGLGRFRTNVFLQRGAVGAVFRVIPYEIKPMKDLGLPQDVCEELCSRPKGLVLVTGATGSGKSTTLASMIDFINRTRNEHIMIVEDPIEFVHRNKCCLVNQREVGNDTRGFGNALRTVLRQDPDVIMVGELRDQESISSALTIAETGHLTFATLHTNDVVQTINRIVDVFPEHQQQQIRTQLSFTLQAVFCQQLVPRADSRGRVLSAEIMVATPAVKALIREDKVHQLMSIIQTGGRYGMRTMNQSLYDLYRSHQVTYDEAMSYSSDPEDLKRIMQKTTA
jgi:twitching motility protein PilT